MEWHTTRVNQAPGSPAGSFRRTSFTQCRPPRRVAQPFRTNQCPPVYEGADLPEELPLQPDGREVTCNCDDGLLGDSCVACDGGTLAEYLGDELEAAVEDSGDVKSCAGGVTVRPSLPVTAHRCACCCCACCC